MCLHRESRPLHRDSRLLFLLLILLLVLVLLILLRLLLLLVLLWWTPRRRAGDDRDVVGLAESLANAHEPPVRWVPNQCDAVDHRSWVLILLLLLLLLLLLQPLNQNSY